MTTWVAWAAALAVLLSPAAPSDAPLPEAVADHDLHPGLGHPHEGEGHHEHGDPDDHHESPDSPCYHHDSHTCCAQSLTFALVGTAWDPGAGLASRIPVPSQQAYAPPFVVEFLHVPLV